MLKVILVRHGETEWNRIHRLQGGDSDTPLNDTGIAQAKRLALRLKDEDIRAVYASPLQRALDTAREIARYHQLEVKTLSSLKEIHVGKLEGADSTKMKLRWDQLLCQEGDSEAGIYGVEPIAHVQMRTWSAIKEIAGEHKEGSVVVVSHYVAIMAIVCAVLGLPLQQIVRLKLNSGTITSFLMYDDGSARLELFNDGCHNLNS